jgi:SAM-dependent methyltransferase
MSQRTTNTAAAQMLKRIVKTVLPRRFHQFASGVYWLGIKYRCSVCGWRLRAFRETAAHPGYKEMCYRCGALARHRFLWLYMKNETNLFSAPLRVLHFAAEACLSERLSAMPHLDYTTADIEPGRMEVLDLMNINKPEASYDVVLCIHVLEHVSDDNKALREILRVLKPGGWAILNPHMDLSLEKTREDPSVTSPEERRRLFNHEDHYRVYGRDIGKRFGDAGLDVEVVPYMEKVPLRFLP